MDAGQIDEKLHEAFDVLHQLQADEREAGTAAALTKVEYEVRFAKALVEVRHREPKMPLDLAKAEATILAEAEYRAFQLADAQLRTSRSTLNVLSTQVDILRTLAVSHRSVFA